MVFHQPYQDDDHVHDCHRFLRPPLRILRVVNLIHNLPLKLSSVGLNFGHMLFELRPTHPHLRHGKCHQEVSEPCPYQR